MDELKKGDVVSLKSGGPRMTVSDVNVGDDRKVECTWFDDKKVLQGGVFPSESLQIDKGGFHFA